MPARNFDVIDDDTIRINLTQPEEAPTARSLVSLQHEAMRTVFAQAGISLATYAMEVVSVARAAAADGEYGAAAQLYKIVGQHIGALAGEKHLHLHAAANPANAEGGGDFRATSDDALRNLIAQAKSASAIQEATVIESTVAVESAPTHDAQQ